MKQLNINYATVGLMVLIAAGLYLFTLDTGLRLDELTGGDLITHQYAQVEARPGNAPGYPLYTMGGWLWFKVGSILLGRALNPIQILSFYSTLWGIGSLVVLYLILIEIGPRLTESNTSSRFETAQPKIIALLLTLFYATTFFFWYYSVTTEQYTSAVFQTLLLIWLAFKWDTSPRDSTLLWMAFISGTMLANMVTTLFILPPLLWFIFFKKIPARSSQNTRSFAIFNYLKRPKLILAAVGVTLLPVLSYTYIYIRGAQHPEWRGEGVWPTTWAWFVQFITIQQGRDELAPGLSLQNFFTHEFPALMWRELTWVIFFGGLIGLVFLDRRRAIFLYSTLVIYFFFSWGYRFGNWFQVIIPAYPIFIIGVAAAIKRFFDWPFQLRSSPQFNNYGRFVRLFILHPSSFILLILAGLLLFSFVASYPNANQRNRPTDTGLDPGWAIVADRPDSPAVVISTFEERVALEYLGTVWGVESELTPTDSMENPEPAKHLYISRAASVAAPEIVQASEVHPQAAGEHLIALSPDPMTQLPSAATTAQLDFGDSLQMVGWEQVELATNLPAGVVQRLSAADRQLANWQLVLYWQASTKLEDDYTISVRPLVGEQLVLQGDEAVIQDHQPVWGVYPTIRWQPNELVRDVYALSLPEDIEPNAVHVVVYKTTDGGFENLGDQVISLD